MYLTNCRHFVPRRKIVFRSGNYSFRHRSRSVNEPFARRMHTKTAEFELRSDGVYRPILELQRCYRLISVGKRVFPALLTHIPGEQSMSFIRVCSPRYDMPGRVSRWFGGLVVEPGPSDCPTGGETIDTRPSTHPHTHDAHTTRLEAHGIVDSRRTMSKLRDTRHTAVRSRLR